MNNREAFEAVCELLPDGVTWGEAITPSIVHSIAQAALASQAQQPTNVWQQAIDDELVNAHLGIAKNGVTREEAKAELNKLIAWHIDVDKYFESQAQQTTELSDKCKVAASCLTYNDAEKEAVVKHLLLEASQQLRRVQAQQESQVIRKAFICPACECVYADSPVSHCDCFENHSNTYIEGSIIYSPAPEGE